MSSLSKKLRQSTYLVSGLAMAVMLFCGFSPLAQALSASEILGSNAPSSVDLRLTSVAKSNFPGGFTATSGSLVNGKYNYTFTWQRSNTSRLGYIYVSQKQSDGLYHIVAKFLNLSGVGTVTSDAVFLPSSTYRISYYSKPYGSFTSDYVILRSSFNTPSANGTTDGGASIVSYPTNCPNGFSPLKLIDSNFYAKIVATYGFNFPACTENSNQANLLNPTTCTASLNLTTNSTGQILQFGSVGKNLPYTSLPVDVATAACYYCSNSSRTGGDPSFDCSPDNHRNLTSPVCPSGWKVSPLVMNNGVRDDKETVNSFPDLVKAANDPSYQAPARKTFQTLNYCIPENAKTLSELDPVNFPTSCPSGYSLVNGAVFERDYIANPVIDSLNKVTASFMHIDAIGYGPAVPTCVQNSNLHTPVCPAGWKADPKIKIISGYGEFGFCVPNSALTLEEIAKGTPALTGKECPNKTLPVSAGVEYNAIAQMYGTMGLFVCDMHYAYNTSGGSAVGITTTPRETCPTGWKYPKDTIWPSSTYKIDPKTGYKVESGTSDFAWLCIPSTLQPNESLLNTLKQASCESQGGIYTDSNTCLKGSTNLFNLPTLR